MDRGGCGLVAGRNFARNGKNPGGGRCASRHQQDHVAPDFSGPLLSLVRPVHYGYSDPYQGLYDFYAVPPYSPGYNYGHVKPGGWR